MYKIEQMSGLEMNSPGGHESIHAGWKRMEAHQPTGHHHQDFQELAAAMSGGLHG